MLRQFPRILPATSRLNPKSGYLLHEDALSQTGTHFRPDTRPVYCPIRVFLFSGLCSFTPSTGRSQVFTSTATIWPRAALSPTFLRDCSTVPRTREGSHLFTCTRQVTEWIFAARVLTTSLPSLIGNHIRPYTTFEQASAFLDPDRRSARWPRAITPHGWAISDSVTVPDVHDAGDLYAGPWSLDIALVVLVLVPVSRSDMGNDSLSPSTVVGSFDICLDFHNELPFPARDRTKPSFHNIRNFFAQK